MSGDTTYQALDRLSYLPGRDPIKNGLCIAGQNYYNVYFTGGEISGLDIDGLTSANDWLNALLPTQTANSGKVLTTNGTNAAWQNNGNGTVTSVSVVSANGFAGSVATATTTPAITLSTSITGLVKGNGTSISAAVQGADYYAPGGTDVALTDGGTGAGTASGARSNLGVITANQLQVTATGTVYTMTDTDALFDFGTTDPSLTISAPGTYFIVATCQVVFNAATFATSRTASAFLRRTTNTPADLTNDFVCAGGTGVRTTYSGLLDNFVMMGIYTTANNNDILQMWGSVSVLPGAGSLQINTAKITATRLQQ